MTTTQTSRQIAIKGGRQIGWAEPVEGSTILCKFTPVSAGYAYQVRCTWNVEAREARSWYRVVAAS